jgi:hypothetical protein
VNQEGKSMESDPIDLLTISIEELLGETVTQSKNNKRGPAPKLQKQVEIISQMPKAKQKLATDLLDAIIQQS